MVLRGFGVDRRIFTHQIKGRVECVDIKSNRLQSVARLVRRFCHDHRNRLAHMADAGARQNGAFGACALAASAGVDPFAFHAKRHALRQKIVGCQHQMHAGHRPCGGHVQRNDLAMGVVGPQEDSPKRALRYQVRDIAPLAGQKPHILAPGQRLGHPEFQLFHRRTSCQKRRRPAWNVQPGAEIRSMPSGQCRPVRGSGQGPLPVAARQSR